MYDLILAGGTVVDPSAGRHGCFDVAIKGGRIAAVEPAIDPSLAVEAFDASGLHVTPGWIDLHSHVYTQGTPIGVHADAVAWRTGVTTWVDAGSAGASNFAGLAEWVAPANRARILAFINISCIGLTADNWELSILGYSDVAPCVRAARDHPAFAVGVKARIDRDTVGPHGLEPLRRARAAADELGLPLMVHISHGPPAIEDVLAHLGEGDVLTHAFTGLSMTALDEQGAPCRALLDARERGVALDVGHGLGSFSFRVAEAMAAHGIWPDAISTDAYTHALRGAVVDLPTCVAKLLALGMGLDDAIRAVTATPARLIGRPDLGTLAVGAEADVAVFALEEGSFALYDVFHDRRTGSRRLRNVLTLRAGVKLPPLVAHGPEDDPISDAWQQADAELEARLRAHDRLPDELLPAAFGPAEPQR